MKDVKQIDAGLLDVGYVDEGPADGPAVVLLHGWPYDIHSYDEVVPLLAAAGQRVVVPYLRGFGTTRFLSEDTFRNGEQAVLAIDVIALLDALEIDQAVVAGFDWGARAADIVAALWPERCNGLVSASGYLIGSQAAGRLPLAPEAELQWWYLYYFSTERGRVGYRERSFDNPDHVDIVIHNYRWRLGVADGERRYDELESRLAEAPMISVPTVTLEGDANGEGVGHNLPQEAPQAFADAVLEIAQ